MPEQPLTPSEPVALITGGATGLGAAIAIDLSSRGYRLAIHYHDSEQEARRLQVKIGEQSLTIFHADLRRLEACEELIRKVNRSMGRLDVLVNNASILKRTGPGELSEDVWAATIDLNIRAVAFLSMYAAGVMRENEGGVILNIGDLAGLEPWPAYLAHAVSKAGVHHLTRCMALAYAPDIRVNALAPGMIDPPPGWTERRIRRFKDRIPGGKPANISDVAAIVADIIGNPSITGQIVAVDRGQSLSF